MRLAYFALFLLLSSETWANVGVTQLAGKEGDGPVTVFYPTKGEERTVARGPFSFRLAENAPPERGNGRLVVISHGSGGNAWVHEEVSRALVEAGFVVALPLHQGDNFRDPSHPGPTSWKRRPVEVSHAIDAVGEDARFAPLLSLDKVGMYGMSAGGHTALTLAGGRWSEAQLAQHCEESIAQDFYGCVGLTFQLTGGPFDGLKQKLALMFIRYRFDERAWQSYTDPRVAAVIAGVPYAADFDLSSLAHPKVPLALVLAEQDRWLVPRFHGKAVAKACAGCEVLADLPTAGHGGLLGPLPPGMVGLVGELLNDPPGFDRRAVVPEVDRKIVDFFRRKLL